MPATTVRQLNGTLPPHTALLEYAILPDSIAIFYFSSSKSGVIQVAAKAAAVRALVERCNDLLQNRGDLASLQREAAALHRLLIAPVASVLAGIDTLVIVPDRQLHTLPFAALFDASRGRYVLDDFAISVAPSAASVIRAEPASPLSPVLVIGDPRDEGAPTLPEAEREQRTLLRCTTLRLYSWATAPPVPALSPWRSEAA